MKKKYKLKKWVKISILLFIVIIILILLLPHKSEEKNNVEKVITQKGVKEEIKKKKYTKEIVEEPQEEIQNTVEEQQVSEQVSEQVQEEVEEPIQETNNLGTYKVTHYGPNCNGGACSGITASGYDVRNTIYYNDSEYGQLRIVATSRDIPLYTVVRIKDYKVGGDTLAIVLDRGVSGNVIDLLVSSEEEAYGLGIQYTNIEIVREG